MIPTRTVLALCARYELLLAIRSRWLQVFAVTFAVLSIAVASAGYIVSGGHGVQDFARTAASLLQLVLLLVPLAALVFGGLALTPDRGAAELLFAQPVSRAAVLAGRMTGVWTALVAAQWIGFGAAGLVVRQQAGTDGLQQYGALVLVAALLTAVFVAIAAFLASGNTGRRTRVLAGALVVWFATAVLFDIAALGIAALLRSGPASRLLLTAALLNPVDAARVAALVAIDGASAFGAATLALFRFAGGPVQTVLLATTSLALWIVLPLLLALRRIAANDI
jgi:Cu-processing system permease protein